MATTGGRAATAEASAAAVEESPAAAETRAEVEGYARAANEALSALEQAVVTGADYRGEVDPETETRPATETPEGETETPPETTETPETETETPETTTEEAPEGEKPQGRAQARIQELIAERKALEARLEALEAKVNTAPPVEEDFVPEWAGGQREESPELRVESQTPERLAAAARIEQLEGVIRIAAENPDGIEIAGRQHDASALRAARAAAEVELSRLRVQEATQAALREAEVNAAAGLALKQVRADPEFAWMKQRAAPQHKLVKQILAQAPQLKNFANWPEVVAILADGLHKRISRSSGASSGTQHEGAAAAAPVRTGAATAARGVNGQSSTSSAGASPAAAGSGAQRRRPAAPLVGTAVPGSAPRAAGAAGRRGQEAAGRAVTQRLRQAADKGDEQGELAALQDLIESGGVQ